MATRFQWGCSLWDLGSGIWNLGFGIWDLASAIGDLRSGVWDLGFGIWDWEYSESLSPPRCPLVAHQITQQHDAVTNTYERYLKEHGVAGLLP